MRLRKMNRWPDSGSAFRRLRTRANRPSKPRRISTASGQYQSLTAAGRSAWASSQGGDQGADEVEVTAGSQAQDGAAGQDEFDRRGGREKADGEEAGGVGGGKRVGRTVGGRWRRRRRQA